jgi:hypothetical protein
MDCLLVLQVDQKGEALLLPIYGVMVPFHITTMRNISNSQENDHAYIRINFNYGAAYDPAAKFPGCIMLKELSFRTSNTKHAARVRPFGGGWRF